MVVANVPQSDFKKGPRCTQCGNHSELVLHLVASRKFQKRLHEGRLEPPEFSPHLQERLQAIYCENCDTLWQLVPDAEFETQKALVGSP